MEGKNDKMILENHLYYIQHKFCLLKRSQKLYLLGRKNCKLKNYTFL